jgi:cbb3-type cytochrome oxidase maturation protein
MSVIFLLIPLSIVIALCFLGAFIWAVRSGQYEDTCTPSLRLLLEEKRAGKKAKAEAEAKGAAKND